MRLNPLSAAILGLALTLSSCGASKDDASSAASQISEELASERLVETVSEFEAVFLAGQIGDTLKFMPPKVKSVFLKAAGGSETRLKTEIQQTWEDALQVISLEEFSFDMSDTSVSKLENGQIYKTIPTYMLMGINADPDTVIEAKSETVAILMDNNWYMVRLDEPEQVKLFRRSYPEFASLEISEATMEQRARSEIQ
mgnify:CR=1 FL=1